MSWTCQQCYAIHWRLSCILPLTDLERNATLAHREFCPQYPHRLTFYLARIFPMVGVEYAHTEGV